MIAKLFGRGTNALVGSVDGPHAILWRRPLGCFLIPIVRVVVGHTGQALVRLGVCKDLRHVQRSRWVIGVRCILEGQKEQNRTEKNENEELKNI